MPGVLPEHRRAEPVSSYRDIREGTCVAAAGPGTGANGLTSGSCRGYSGGLRRQIAVLRARFLGQPTLKIKQFFPEASVSYSQDLNCKQPGIAPSSNRYSRNGNAAR